MNSVISTNQTGRLTKPKHPNCVWACIHNITPHSCELFTLFTQFRRAQFPLLKNWFENLKFLFFCIIYANLVTPSTIYTVLHYAMIALREPAEYEFLHVYEEIKIRVDKHSQEKQDELGNVANKYNEQKLRTYSDTFFKTWWSIFNEFAGLWKKRNSKSSKLQGLLGYEIHC